MKDEFTEAAIGEDAHVTTVSLYAEHLRRTKERLRKRNRCGSQRRKRRKRRKIFRYRWSGVRKRKNACPLDTKLFLLPKPRFFPKIKGSVSVYVVPRGG